MKYIDEFRDPELAKNTLAEISRTITQPWVIMEICGGQTHSIKRYGVDQLLPEKIELVHGPGCPVCVTPLEQIDKALAIASHPEVIFTSYGDMLRVPGSGKDLFSVRAAGGDVRVVYSPLDAVKIAQENPEKEVVFFAIGFETTAPANAMAIAHAKRMNLKNFSVLVSHVRVPPAMHAILGSPSNRVQGFLAAGPLRDAAERLGKRDFSAHYCGQSAALGRRSSAYALTVELASNALRHFEPLSAVRQ